MERGRKRESREAMLHSVVTRARSMTQTAREGHPLLLVGGAPFTVGREERIMAGKTVNTLVLKVDGEEIDIGPFVRDIVSSGILGTISALKGVDNPKKVEIVIEVG
jgi:hypothetical protein